MSAAQTLIHKVTLALIAASPFFVAPLATADARCDPQTLDAPASFPARSQLRDQKGIVLVNVVVNKDGTVQSASVHRSSGYRLLDRAAVSSVARNWRFDVSNCKPEELPRLTRVALEYRASESRRRAAAGQLANGPTGQLAREE